MSRTTEGARLTDEYRAALRAQAARVARVLAAACTGVDPGSIDASMRRVLPQAAIAITGGQGKAAELSYVYLRRFVAAELALELDVIPLPDFDPDPYLGTTVSGRTVREALGFQPVYAKAAIAKGATGEQAVAKSLRNLQMVGRSELYRVARVQLIEAAASTNYIERYQRIASPSACAFCRMLAGRGPVYRLETVGFRTHGNCGCTAEPVVRATRALRLVS